jgi:hypothetical protein
MLGIMSIKDSKNLFSSYELQGVWSLIFDSYSGMIETLFHLGWSKLKADLSQTNSSLKHFGIVPRIIIAIMNHSTWNHILIFIFPVKKKYGGLTDLFISWWKSPMQQNACWVFETVWIILIIIQFDLFYREGLRFEPV